MVKPEPGSATLTVIDPAVVASLTVALSASKPTLGGLSLSSMLNV